MYEEDEYLALSGIQHFAYCERQWALIHLEQSWADNELTSLGDLLHDRAHDMTIRERRGDKLIVRGLAVRSSELGLYGVCDVVEFNRSALGHPLFGEDGLWRAYPVEYKKGLSKVSDIDRYQLCAQAIALEEMLCSEISEGALYYGTTRSRETVSFDDDLRNATKTVANKMHVAFRRGITPAAKRRKGCKSCSLRDLCLPYMPKRQSVSGYIEASLKEDS